MESTPIRSTNANVATVGLDLAKRVFQVHGADAQGRQLFNKALKREQLAGFFLHLPPCVVAMEACSSAHHWARRIAAQGHQVRLIAAQHVRAYVQGNKHDAADAAAICEAASRPRMRFVSVKTPEQQALLSLHRVRSGLVKERTACANQMRGLLAEYGLIIPKGLSHIKARVPDLIEDATQELPGIFRQLIDTLLMHFKNLDDQVLALQQQIMASAASGAARLLQSIPGIGPISACALAASIGQASDFKSGRHLAAWLGLTPSQRSSGGKVNMGGISKRGDAYLRSLLIHGARSVVSAMQRRQRAMALDAPAPLLSAHQAWLQSLLQRKPVNVAAVALAAKNARIVWAVLNKGRAYDSAYADCTHAGGTDVTQGLPTAA